MTVTREQFVAVAESWIPTPYLPQVHGQVKHAGANCGTYLYGVLKECGFVSEQDEPEVFANNWECHTTDEKYLKRIIRHGWRVAQGISSPTLRLDPGNLVLTRTPGARVFNHGGIVVKWPTVLHCAPSYGVCKVNAVTNWLWAHRELTFFDPWKGEDDGTP